MSVQYPKLQRMFDNDSKLWLETLRRLLSHAAPGDFPSDDVDRAFRAAHSIKSEAGFLNQDGIARVAHRLEDTLSEVRNREGSVSPETAADLRDGYAALALALKAYRRSRQTVTDAHDERPAKRVGTPESAVPTGELPGEATAANGNASDVPAKDSAVVRASAHEPVGLESPRTGGGHPTTIEGVSRAEQGMIREALRRGERLYRLSISLHSHELGYARAFLVVNNLELDCAVIRTEPSLEEMGDSAATEFVAYVTTAASEELIRRAVHVDEVELTSLSEISLRDVADAGRDSQATGVMGDQSLEEGALLAAEIAALAVRVEQDEDVDSGTRLVRMREYARVIEDRLLRDTLVDFSDALLELRDRSVRYARRQGKRVRISVDGPGALVAPAVSDTLMEALLHLIRNSIDHGIETIEARARKGRHPAATISIRVDAIGDRVRIVVRDDGTGIDESALRHEGDEGALIDVLARAGVSTRESADESSGRGVGLNTVVHSVRELLGGSIEVENRPGRGASFVIMAPAASRLTRVLVVRSGRSLYAIPSATVLARYALDERKVRKDSLGALYYDVRGESIPFVMINGHSPSEKRLRSSPICLHVRGGAMQRILVVEAVEGEEAVVRDRSAGGMVHSRVFGAAIPYVYPGSLEAE